MSDPLPILPVLNPHISILDLVALARPGEDKAALKRFIKKNGVELNAHHLKVADHMVTVQTGDILRLGPGDWHEIKVIDVNEIETERMKLRALQAEDIELIEDHLPEWDIVKYLAANLPPAMQDEISAREVFRQVIEQAEPKSEWLWKIMEKEAPEKIVGVAHMHKNDVEHGRQNIWLDRAHRKDGVMEEVMTALNEHAFEKLGISDIEFKEAFAHAAGSSELDALRKKFSTADDGSELHTRDAPDKSWGLNKKKWQDIKEQRERPRYLAELQKPPPRGAAPPPPAAPAVASPASPPPSPAQTLAALNAAAQAQAASPPPTQPASPPPAQPVAPLISPAMAVQQLIEAEMLAAALAAAAAAPPPVSAAPPAAPPVTSPAVTPPPGAAEAFPNLPALPVTGVIAPPGAVVPPVVAPVTVAPPVNPAAPLAGVTLPPLPLPGAQPPVAPPAPPNPATAAPATPVSPPPVNPFSPTTKK